jgi:hypothetical protein
MSVIDPDGAFVGNEYRTAGGWPSLPAMIACSIHN